MKQNATTHQIKGQMNLFEGFGEEVCEPLVDIFSQKEDCVETVENRNSATKTKYLCTRKHLQELFQNAKDIILAENLPLGHVNEVCSINEKMSAWGLCETKRINGEKHCQISVSSRLLETTEKSVMQTLLHELLHATEGCYGHDALWKSRASRINAKYGYQIQRTNSAKELGIEKDDLVDYYCKNYKYVIQCCDCGQVSAYKRMAKVIKYPEFYSCRCGGKLKRIK